MAKRVCRIPSCPTISDQKLCTTHRTEHEKSRGTRQQRGYGAEHDAERARIRRIGIEFFQCARCGRAFAKGERFHLGHTDDRTSWSGPEHELCNLSAAGRASHGR